MQIVFLKTWNLKWVGLNMSGFWDNEIISFCTRSEWVSYIMTKTSYIRWDDNNVRFVLDQHGEL